MANIAGYGFRFVRGTNGSKDVPVPERMAVASGYQAAVNGGGNVDLNVGDVVKRLSTGFVALCDGTEDTAEIPLGVIMGFTPYFDGTDMKPANVLPGNTVYGSNLRRQSFALVVPIESGIWEVDIDAAASGYDTQAEWQALIGERVSMVNSYDAAGSKADPQIDISTHATTITLMFTIYGLSTSLNSTDYAGANFKLLITANRYAAAPNTVGV